MRRVLHEFRGIDDGERVSGHHLCAHVWAWYNDEASTLLVRCRATPNCSPAEWLPVEETVEARLVSNEADAVRTAIDCADIWFANLSRIAQEAQ